MLTCPTVQKPHVTLIGCGLGDPDLLTLRAYKAIQSADVILYDHLITDEILWLIPNKTKRIYVGKQKKCHSMTQDEINDLLIDYARQGLHVARLKSGDPYIFGRGAEEALALTEQGYRVDVINGLSSSIAAASCAGIPPTARGYATGFSVVSAHLKGSRVTTDWIDFLKVPNHTTIVLMGLSVVREIVAEALEQGVDPTLPAAIIANASRSNQQVVISNLEELDVAAEGVNGPAVIVFGDVVNLHKFLPYYTPPLDH